MSKLKLKVKGDNCIPKKSEKLRKSNTMPTQGQQKLFSFFENAPECSTAKPLRKKLEAVETKSKYFETQSSDGNHDESFSEFLPEKFKKTQNKMTKTVASKKVTKYKDTTGKKAKNVKSQARKENLLKYTENFEEVCAVSGIDVNPEHLQLAIALSRSLSDYRGNGNSTGDDSNQGTFSETLVNHEFQNEEEKVKKIRKTLDQYGFRVPSGPIVLSSKSNTKRKKNNILKSNSALILRSLEEKKQTVTDSVSKIIFECRNIDLDSLDSSKIKPSSDVLQEIWSDKSILFSKSTLEFDEMSNEYNVFYVKNLVTPSDSKVGCLLKDWSTIPGRDSSPERKLEILDFKENDLFPESFDILLSSTRSHINDKIYTIQSKKESPTKISQTAFLNEKKCDLPFKCQESETSSDNVIIVRSSRSCSPDLFGDESYEGVNDLVFTKSSRISKKHDSPDLNINKTCEQNNASIYSKIQINSCVISRDEKETLKEINLPVICVEESNYTLLNTVNLGESISTKRKCITKETVENVDKFGTRKEVILKHNSVESNKDLSGLSDEHMNISSDMFSLNIYNFDKLRNDKNDSFDSIDDTLKFDQVLKDFQNNQEIDRNTRADSSVDLIKDDDYKSEKRNQSFKIPRPKKSHAYEIDKLDLFPSTSQSVKENISHNDNIPRINTMNSQTLSKDKKKKLFDSINDTMRFDEVLKEFQNNQEAAQSNCEDYSMDHSQSNMSEELEYNSIESDKDDKLQYVSNRNDSITEIVKENKIIKSSKNILNVTNEFTIESNRNILSKSIISKSENIVKYRKISFDSIDDTLRFNEILIDFKSNQETDQNNSQDCSIDLTLDDDNSTEGLSQNVDISKCKNFSQVFENDNGIVHFESYSEEHGVLDISECVSSPKNYSSDNVEEDFERNNSEIIPQLNSDNDIFVDKDTSDSFEIDVVNEDADIDGDNNEIDVGIEKLEMNEEIDVGMEKIVEETDGENDEIDVGIEKLVEINVENERIDDKIDRENEEIDVENEEIDVDNEEINVENEEIDVVNEDIDIANIDLNLDKRTNFRNENKDEINLTKYSPELANNPNDISRSLNLIEDYADLQKTDSDEEIDLTQYSPKLDSNLSYIFDESKYLSPCEVDLTQSSSDSKIYNQDTINFDGNEKNLNISEAIEEKSIHDGSGDVFIISDEEFNYSISTPYTEKTFIQIRNHKDISDSEEEPNTRDEISEKVTKNTKEMEHYKNEISIFDSNDEEKNGKFTGYKVSNFDLCGSSIFDQIPDNDSHLPNRASNINDNSYDANVHSPVIERSNGVTLDNELPDASNKLKDVGNSCVKNLVSSYETPPNNKYVIKTDNVTPIQNYSNMDTPSIHKELSKFGLKPLKRKRAVQLLEHIYNQTHPVVDINDLEMKLKRRKIQQSVSPSSKLSSTKEPTKAFNKPKGKKAKMDDFDCGRSEEEQMEYKAHCDQDIYSPDTETISLNQIKCDPADWVFQSREKSKFPSCRVPLHIAFHNYLSVRKKLREAILRYDPVNIDMIHKGLVADGYRYNAKELFHFMDKKCITIKTTDKNGGTRQKKR